MCINFEEIKKMDLLQLFLKGEVPVCQWDCWGDMDFNTEQGMLSKTPEEINDFIEKYGEDPFEDDTHSIINYLIENIPENKPYCDIFRAEMYCVMIMNKGIESVISLVENCLTCDMECNAIYGHAVNSPAAKDFIEFIEHSYSIYINDNKSSHCFKLTHKGTSVEDWYLISKDKQFQYKLFKNKNVEVVKNNE